MMSSYSICLLGPIQISKDQRSLQTLRSRKGLALLGYLSQQQGPVSRTALAELLWPEKRGTSGLRNLSRELSQLSSQLPGCFENDYYTLEFRPGANYWLDTQAFNQALSGSDFKILEIDLSSAFSLETAYQQRPQLGDDSPTQWGTVVTQGLGKGGTDPAQIVEIIPLYRGDFMAGNTLEECPEFESWLHTERESWRQRVSQLLEGVSAAYLIRHEDRLAELYLKQWLALEPWRERAHRYLMLLLARKGQHHEALLQYELCRQVLARTLAVEPDAATVSLAGWIKKEEMRLQKAKKAGRSFQADAPTLPTLSPTLRSACKQVGAYPAVSTQATQATQAARTTKTGYKPLPSNLPELVAPFVGRAEELVRLENYLKDAACRLVTITGLGGTGKTWLALQAARTASATPDFAEGVFFVPLGGLEGTVPGGSEEIRQQVVTAIAGAIGLEPGSQVPPLNQLKHYLQAKRLLLVLDNFEHLAASGGELIIEILQAASHLKVLVTSRERLGLLGEWILALEGLDYPPIPPLKPDWGWPEALLPSEEQWQTPAGAKALATFSAVQLLEQRTRQVKPAFMLTPEEGPAIARLCQMVEGMPLALELIAAQMAVFSPAELTAVLTNNLERLNATWANLPARQRNLRAVFEHSWSLLDPADLISLAQLSVFRGGFNLAAAEAVAGANWGRLLRLVDKSLVRPVAGRYELHELLRQFIVEKLGGAGVLAAQDRHSDYYLDSLQQQQSALFGTEPHQATALLRPELENIRQAWEWAVAKGYYDKLALALEALARFYEVSGFIREATSSFSRAAGIIQAQLGGETRSESASTAEISLFSRLLIQQGRFFNMLGRSEEALRLAQQSISLAQQIADTPILPTLSAGTQAARTTEFVSIEASGYMVQGYAFIKQGKFQEARQRLKQGARLAQLAGDERLEAYCLSQLAHRLDNDMANLERSLQIARRLGDYWLEYQILIHLGGMASNQGLLDHARHYWQQVLDYTLTINNPYRAAYLQNNLGNLYGQLAAYNQAFGYLEQALPIFRKVGDRYMEVCVLEGLSRLHLLTGNGAAGLELVRTGLALAQEQGGLEIQAYLYNVLGHLLAVEKEYGTAQSAYEQALQFSQKTNPNIALESHAGLARLSLVHNELAIAQTHVETILAFLEQGGILDGYTGPVEIYLTCYQTLQANQDPRAPGILAAAQQWLQKQAEAIEDVDLRHSFLENSLANRELRSLLET
jgi:predicted ATPase/DNA-binding SARP family transcriptional activator